MGESPLNFVLDNLSSNRPNISKNGQFSDGLDSTLLSDSPPFSLISNLEGYNSALNNEFNLSVQSEEDFLNLIHSQSFEEYVKSSDFSLTRRYSCPCFNTDYHFNGFNFYDDLNYNFGSDHQSDKLPKNKTFSRFRSLDNMKRFSTLRNNTWGSLINRFRKFCLESNKCVFSKSPSSGSDSSTLLKTSSDLTLNSLDKPLSASNGEPIQYAVFKPINLSISKAQPLNGFVSSREDKEDVVFVVKSNTGQPITKYGLTRIISCTSRQEYEVVDHNTGDYYLLKLTNDPGIFNIYETLFDQPHPNLVEVTQLLTNVDSSNLEVPSPLSKNGQIYYILLNSFKYTALSDYHINTLPSLIDFNVLKLIVKGLLKALVYLHSRSLVLSKLTMKSVIICRSQEVQLSSGDEIVAKIVDLDDAKVCRSRKDMQNDIRLVGNLLFNFIEGKQVVNNHVFKSNLWTLCPQMFDFCLTALAKLSSFNSATEALIHPWITSLE